jgi:hypothetical protein
MSENRRAEIQRELEEIQARWPAHSPPPALMARLDELELELETLNSEELDAEEDGIP